MVSDQGLVWLFSIGALVISDECAFSHHQLLSLSHDLECPSVRPQPVRVSLSAKGWRRREGSKSSSPPQLSIQRERKFDMVDLNTFSIISKQEVSPAAVLQLGEGGVPSPTVMDKCYPLCLPLIFDLKTKIDITNVL